MRIFPLILLFCASTVFAEVPSKEALAKESWKILEKELVSEKCISRAKEFSEFRLLLAVPEFNEFLTAPSKVGKLTPVLSTWSTDLLIRITLQLEQELRPACGALPASLESLLKEIKSNFLGKLGIPVDKMAPNDVAFLFRGLVSLKEDAVRIEQRIRKLKFKKFPRPRALLKLLFGNVTELRGVVVLSPRPFDSRQMENYLKEACPVVSCPFWDSSVLYKMVIVSEPGLAAYLPEVGTLVISQEIFQNLNLLHKVTLLHELAHVAERGAWLKDRDNWMERFVLFSGWQKSEAGDWSVEVDKQGVSRNDKLTQLSANSPFSILPDPVYLGVKREGRPHDGFVMAKAYDESIRQNDPVEDLADHVAIFRFVPERFCWEKKAIAPGKFRWIAETIFKVKPVTSCDASGSVK